MAGVQLSVSTRPVNLQISGARGPAGVKGDPGGNVMSVGLFAALAGLLIPIGTDMVQTSGSQAVGVGAARYAALNSPPTGIAANGYTTQTANGRWFQLACEGQASLQQFGPVDLTGAASTASANTSTMNAAHGFMIARGGGKLLYPGGQIAFDPTAMTPIGTLNGADGSLDIEGAGSEFSSTQASGLVGTALLSTLGTVTDPTKPLGFTVYGQACRVAKIGFGVAAGVTPAAATIAGQTYWPASFVGLNALGLHMEAIRFNGGGRQRLLDGCSRIGSYFVQGQGATGDYASRIQGVYNTGHFIQDRFSPAYPTTTGVFPASTTTDAQQIAGGVNSLYFFDPQYSHGNTNLKIGDDNDTQCCQLLRFFSPGLESGYTANLKLNTAKECEFPGLYANLSNGYGIWVSALMDVYGGPCKFPYGQASANAMQNRLIQGDPGLYFGPGFDSGGNVSNGVYPQVQVSCPKPRLREFGRIGGTATAQVGTNSRAPCGYQIDRVSSIAAGQPAIKLGGAPTLTDTITVTVGYTPPVVVTYQPTAADLASGGVLGSVANNLASGLQNALMGQPVNVDSPASQVVLAGLPASTSLTVSTSSGAGVTASVLRTINAGDTQTLTFTSPGGTVTTISRPILSADTATTITAGFLTLLQASTPLASFGFTLPIPSVIYANQQTAGWRITAAVTSGSSAPLIVRASTPMYKLSPDADLSGNVVPVIDYTDPSPSKSNPFVGSGASAAPSARIAASGALVVGQTYAIDSTAPRTFTVPALSTVVDMARIPFSDLSGQSETNTITFQGSGSDLISYAGLSLAAMPFNRNNGRGELIADQTAGLWRMVA